MAFYHKSILGFCLWLPGLMAQIPGHQTVVTGEKPVDKLAGVPLNDKYGEGRGLIYDCLDKHYACIDGPSWTTCKNDYQGFKIAKAAQYPCVPLKRFKDLKTCKEEQLKLINRSRPHKFCYDHSRLR